GGPQRAVVGKRHGCVRRPDLSHRRLLGRTLFHRTFAQKQREYQGRRRCAQAQHDRRPRVMVCAPRMVRTSSADTPLMRQYLEVKDRYPDAILFFRLGDFYEMFFEDAVYVARTLDLTLTTRDKGREDPIPMCGVPHHSVRHYIARLLELG